MTFARGTKVPPPWSKCYENMPARLGLMNVVISKALLAAASGHGPRPKEINERC